jgi:AGCS family alanine or glycine:cation symporter
LYDNPDDPGAISHFQALSAALSATVGLGNIGGVALAIGIGGPGALFWMWIVGVFGMGLKTVEITLAMMYRNTDDPENPHGGAMWVVEKVIGGRGGKWKIVARTIGIFFCITLLISAMTGGNMFQAWNVAELTEGYFQVDRLITGLVMAALVGMVIIGGIKRIGQVAGKLVPFMCVVYVIAALAVLAMHVTEIPGLLVLIVKTAFQPSEAVGAFVGGSMGFAFMQGMKRALFSNEAGQGSAPIAHAAAKTNEPSREGIVGGIGPFIDTLGICTVTALVILSTGTWNRDAIGDYKSEIELVRDASAEIATWTVQTQTTADRLPEDGDDNWKKGAKFFLVAKVVGATHIESGRDRIQVNGKLQREADRLLVEWDKLVFPPDEWTSTPNGVSLVDQGVYRTYAGANLTGHAFDREFPGLGKWLVTFAAWLFAISTMISWSYYGEQGVVYMFGVRGVLPYKIIYLIGTVWAAAAIKSDKEMIPIMDLGTGAMLWANIPIVMALGYLAVRNLNDYGKRLKAGEFKRRDDSGNKDSA